MKKIGFVTLEDFQKGITQEKVRTLQILCGALGMGILIFTGVVIFLHFQGMAKAPTPKPENFQFSTVLSLVHGLAGISILGMAFFLPLFLLKQGLNQETSDEADLGQQCLGRITGYYIVKMALLEGIALLGLVVCLLSSMNGVLYRESVYWANLATPFIFWAILLSEFPTEKRMIDLLIKARPEIRPGA